MFSSQDRNRAKSWLRLRPAVKSWIVCIILIFTFLSITIFSVGYYFAWQAEKYDLNLVVIGTDQSALYDVHNQTIGYIDGDRNRLVQYDDLPPLLIKALLAREDDSFFSHAGVDYMSFFRSLLRNLKSMRYKQGGSTISMQLTRNVYELRAKSIERKLLEIALTMRIEQRYSKELILTQYFNRIYYGESCYGIADAAWHYFSKEVRDLNLSECACLVGLVRGPSIFNPVVNMEKAIQVRNETLERMLIHEFITQEQYEATVAQAIELHLAPSDASFTSYPLMLVPNEIKKFESCMSDDTGSIALVSSFRMRIQKMVEEASERCLSFMEGDAVFDPQWLDIVSKDVGLHPRIEKRWVTKLKRPEQMPRWSKNDLADVLQCAVLVVDARTNKKGSILAMTGGRDYRDGRNRWLKDLELGDAAAPLLYCAALEPSSDAVTIVPDKLRQTGRRVGFDNVLRVFRELNVLKGFPDAQHADDLYQGAFVAQLQDLAQLYYSILYQGKKYDFDFIRFIYSQNRQLLYAYHLEEREEILRRESTRVVATLPPFHVSDNAPTYANITLPHGGGQWTLVSSRLGVCVFVWMGFDDSSRPQSTDRDLQKLCEEFALILAKQIHQESLDILESQEK